MQMVKKIFFTLFLLWISFIVFMPKQEIYFGLEKELAKQGIEINEGMIEEGVFDLVLNDVTVYVEGVKVATVKRISFFTVLWYSKVKIEEMHTDKGLKSIISVYMEKTVLFHSVMNPLHVYFKARGDIGELKGDISLSDHKARIEFMKEKNTDILKRFLKEDEAGWYYGF